MSADNTIAIRSTADGRFAVNMEFLSCEYPPFASPTESDAIFRSHQDAVFFALNWLRDDPYVEYGLSDYSCNHNEKSVEQTEPEWDSDEWYDFYSREWDGDAPVVPQFDGDDSPGWFEDEPKYLYVGMVDPELERLLQEEEEIEHATREWHENQMADRYERNVLGL